MIGLHFAQGAKCVPKPLDSKSSCKEESKLTYRIGKAIFLCSLALDNNVDGSGEGPVVV